jgi:hypothetical protein
MDVKALNATLATRAFFSGHVAPGKEDLAALSSLANAGIQDEFHPLVGGGVGTNTTAQMAWGPVNGVPAPALPHLYRWLKHMRVQGGAAAAAAGTRGVAK